MPLRQDCKQDLCLPRLVNPECALDHLHPLNSAMKKPLDSSPASGSASPWTRDSVFCHLLLCPLLPRGPRPNQDGRSFSFR